MTGQDAVDAMTIAVTGASGLVGRALSTALRAEGHRVYPVVRREATGDAIAWRPDRGDIERDRFEDLDAVVHLAGENIAGGRWTPSRKARIRDSRVQGTDLLARTLAALERPPAVLVSASAVGIYGDAGDTVLDEDAPPGTGFLAEVGQAWEGATAPAEAAGIRVVHARSGIVLSPEGGALAKMLPPFRLGLGGPLGSGRQWMSWISIDDAVQALVWALRDTSLSGPVNVVAPEATTNEDFTRALANALHRPALFRVPEWALRAALGDMADEALLSSARVTPAKLLERKFPFRHATLASALAYVLR